MNKVTYSYIKPLEEASKTYKSYLDILEEVSALENKNNEILKELSVNLSATDIVSLLRDPKRLDEVLRKLKLKAFW